MSIPNNLQRQFQTTINDNSKQPSMTIPNDKCPIRNHQLSFQTNWSSLGTATSCFLPVIEVLCSPITMFPLSTRLMSTYDLWFMVFNATFNNTPVISWRAVVLVEETRVLEKKPTDLRFGSFSRTHNQRKCLY